MGAHMIVALLVSFLVDWLLLMGINTISNSRHGPGRMAVAAILGGLHAGACMVSGFTFLSSILWRTVFLCIMGLFAYDFDARLTARFMLVNLSLGGFVSGLENGKMREVFLILAVFAVLCLVGFWSKPKGNGYVPVRIPTPNGEVTITALCDTGNTLKDPITGKTVLVASASVGQQVLGIPLEEIKDPVNTVTNRTGYRLIPYNSVGGAGLLLAKRMENVMIGNKNESVLMAFAPNEIGMGLGFQALTGGSV